jgi:hypothetical protein
VLENEREKAAKRNAEAAVEAGTSAHMARLIRGEGPLPPMLAKRLERDYKML